MKSDASSIAQGDLQELSPDVVQVRMLRELFARTRESAIVGVPPVLLLGWAHRDAQPIQYILYWAIAVFFCAVLPVPGGAPLPEPTPTAG